MAFSLKKVFKKVCALGGALMFMSPLVSPVANASHPGTAYGIKLANYSATITGTPIGDYIHTIEVTLNPNLTYTGNPIQLFNGVTYKDINDDPITLLADGVVPYFRIAPSGSTAAVQQGDWKTNIASLTATDRGTYDLFYYIDGGTTYEDSGSDTSTQQNQG